MVPSWTTAVKAAPGSSQPRKAGTMRRWAVLEIGRNSVSPCVTPRTISSISDTSGEPYWPARRSVLGVPEALPGGLDLLEGVLARVPAVDRDLLALQVLVDREEVGDLVTELLW